MSIGSEYLDIDLGLQLIGLCGLCGDPIMENERIIRTEAGLCCEICVGLREEND